MTGDVAHVAWLAKARRSSSMASRSSPERKTSAEPDSRSSSRSRRPAPWRVLVLLRADHALPSVFVRDTHTLVVGGGQAGLAMSYQLARRGVEHVVFERGRIAETWRSQRWDSFTVVGPNSSVSLPGAAYAGREPDGFMARDDLVAYFESYARLIQAPLETGVEVVRLEPDGAGWRVVWSTT